MITRCTEPAPLAAASLANRPVHGPPGRAPYSEADCAAPGGSRLTLRSEPRLWSALGMSSTLNISRTAGHIPHVLARNAHPNRM
jgi:hypothetical protein